jgi:predicted transcriptional regulator
MVRVSLRLPDDLHDKLRWLAYAERRSQHAIILELLKTSLKDVKVPRQGRQP